MLLRFWKDTQVVLHADLVVYVPVMLQVCCVLVELLAVYTAHGIHDQVFMQVTGVDALLTAGNRCNPYLDTVGNGSALGKPGIYDPQLDPKPLKPTPNFLDFDPPQKARSDRLCRAL